MRTRAKGPAKTAAEATESSKSANSKVQLVSESTNPPKLFIVPNSVGSEACIVSLENPKNFTKSRYFVCPENGFYEFTRVAAPKTTPRSWLLSQNQSIASSHVGDEQFLSPLEKCKSASNGYVTQNADLFIATPIDPLFFLLPALAPPPTTNSKGPPNRFFLSGDDYLEKIISASPQLVRFSTIDLIRASLERRLAAVCDTVAAGGETMYRMSEDKLLQELLRKAEKMTEHGLPLSLEEKFIRKALEVPMHNMKRDETPKNHLTDEEDIVLPDSTLPTSIVDTPDTQTTVSSTFTDTSSFSEASTASTSFSDDSTSTSALQITCKLLPRIAAPDGVAQLLRIRTAFFFICSKYISGHLSEVLTKRLTSPTSTIDFSRLEIHLAQLTKLRQDVIAARSIGDFSRKRSMIEDDESGELRSEKRRKKEEEEKRKRAGESRGVKNLQKVNVTGMKKMSDFFKRK